MRYELGTDLYPAAIGEALGSNHAAFRFVRPGAVTTGAILLPHRRQTESENVFVDADLLRPNPDEVTKKLLDALRTPLPLSGLALAEHINNEFVKDLPHGTPLHYLLLPTDSVRTFARHNPELLPWSTGIFDMSDIPEGRIKAYQEALRMYTLRAKRPLNIDNVRVMSVTELMDNSHIIKGKQNAEFLKALVARPILAPRR